MSEILLQEEDFQFASLMVRYLNMILLTSSELFDLRDQLRELATAVRKWHSICFNWFLSNFYFVAQFNKSSDVCLFVLFLLGELLIVLLFIPVLVSQSCSNSVPMFTDTELPTRMWTAYDLVSLKNTIWNWSQLTVQSTNWGVIWYASQLSLNY